MIKLNLKTDDVAKLFEGRYTQTHPHLMKKYDALCLKHYGLHNSLICNILQICNNTLPGYFKEYNEGGLEKLNKKTNSGNFWKKN